MINFPVPIPEDFVKVYLMFGREHTVKDTKGCGSGDARDDVEDRKR